VEHTQRRTQREGGYGDNSLWISKIDGFQAPKGAEQPHGK